jgi:hypothetical protein
MGARRNRRDFLPGCGRRAFIKALATLPFLAAPIFFYKPAFMSSPLPPITSPEFLYAFWCERLPSYLRLPLVKFHFDLVHFNLNSKLDSFHFSLDPLLFNLGVVFDPRWV